MTNEHFHFTLDPKRVYACTNEPCDIEGNFKNGLVARKAMKDLIEKNLNEKESKPGLKAKVIKRQTPTKPSEPEPEKVPAQTEATEASEVVEETPAESITPTGEVEETPSPVAPKKSSAKKKAAANVASPEELAAEAVALSDKLSAIKEGKGATKSTSRKPPPPPPLPPEKQPRKVTVKSISVEPEEVVDETSVEVAPVVVESEKNASTNNVDDTKVEVVSTPVEVKTPKVVKVSKPTEPKVKTPNDFTKNEKVRFIVLFAISTTIAVVYLYMAGNLSFKEGLHWNWKTETTKASTTPAGVYIDKTITDQTSFDGAKKVPSRLLINSIGVNYPIEKVELNKNHELVPPNDPQSIGWWDGSAAPENREGQVVLTGHSVHDKGPEVGLNSLGKLKLDDRIIVKSHGKTYTYKVSRVQKIARPDVAKFQTEFFGQNYRPNRLVLITCSEWLGDHDKNNLIVFAEQVPNS